MARAKKESAQSYEAPSTWNALLYVGITALLIFGPAALPSITLGEVVIVYIGLAMVGYVVLCLLGVRQAIKRSHGAGPGRAGR